MGVGQSPKLKEHFPPQQNKVVLAPHSRRPWLARTVTNEPQRDPTTLGMDLKLEVYISTADMAEPWAGERREARHLGWSRRPCACGPAGSSQQPQGQPCFATGAAIAASSPACRKPAPSNGAAAPCA